MDEESNPGTYKVQAIHPDREPAVEEIYPTATEANVRAGQLFAAGYIVTVVYSRTHKDEHARRSTGRDWFRPS
jgi:hypothetical protein